MKVIVAATQMACDWDKEGNIVRAESLNQDAQSTQTESRLLVDETRSRLEWVR